MTKRYLMIGAQALELPGAGRIEPGSGEFEAEIGEAQERQLIACGAIAAVEARPRRVPFVPREAEEIIPQESFIPDEAGAPPQKRRGR